MAEPSDRSLERNSSRSSSRTGEGVVIDLGTGDGTFVYQLAKEHPNKFYIGIDPNPRALEKISEKIHRKPAKGGLGNVLFVQSAIEDLPEELNGVADEVHVHFPWGSLLHAVATGERAALASLRRICAPDALLEIVTGLDPERDRAEIERLGLPALSVEYIDSVLAPRYAEAGFELLERGLMSATLRTSWAKRLRGGEGRKVFYFLFRCAGVI